MGLGDLGLLYGLGDRCLFVGFCEFSCDMGLGFCMGWSFGVRSTRVYMGSDC